MRRIPRPESCQSVRLETLEPRLLLSADLSAVLPLTVGDPPALTASQAVLVEQVPADQPEPAGDSSGTFVERFDGTHDNGWVVLDDPAYEGLWLDSDGFHFLVGGSNPTPEGTGWAYAAFEAGTGAFELTYEVTLTGQSLPWNWRHGLYVGLASAIPGSEGTDDVSIFAGAITPGGMGSVYQGVVGDFTSPAAWMGGGSASAVAWYDEYILPGTTLNISITRSASNLLTFTIYNDQLADGDAQPWYQGTWQMTTAVAAQPLHYVVVRTTGGYGGAPLSGQITDIQARLLSEAAAPVPEGLTQGQPVLTTGSVVTVTGQDFVSGAVVRVGGTNAATTFLSSTQLQATLPSKAGNAAYSLEVVNPNGLVGELDGGVIYGRLLQRIDPREAATGGGDVVTVHGGGFEGGTVFYFNGVAGTIEEYLGPNAVKVRTPAGTTGLATVMASTGGSSFAGSPTFAFAPHPYLFFDQSELADLQAKFDDPAYADYRQAILNAADDSSSEFYRRGQELAWAYVLSQDVQYKDELLALVEATWDSLDHSQWGLIQGGTMAHIYDMLFHELTPEQKTEILEYLDRGLLAYKDMEDRSDWFLTNTSNTMSVGNAAGGMMALALRYGSSMGVTYTTEAINRIKNYPSLCIGSDGGYVEGTLYWEFGLNDYLQFATMLDHALGDTQLLGRGNLDENHRFIETIYGGDDILFTFNDTQPWLTGIDVMAWLGWYYDDDLMRWMADHVAYNFAERIQPIAKENAWGSNAAMAFYYRDAVAAPASFPGLPNVSVLDQMEWGVLRSDGGVLTPGLVVGVKGDGGTHTHHAQNDAASFVLQANGEGYLIDPGYYQSEATKHSLPLIDGVGPAAATTAPIINTYESAAPELRSMTVQAGSAYANASRYNRVFVTHYDEALIILDDIVATGTGLVTSQYQAGFEAVLGGDGRSAVVTGDNGRLVLQTFGPSQTLAVSGPQDWGSSWVYKRLGTDWYEIGGDYTADESMPLITVLMPTGLTGSLPAAAVAYNGSTIDVTLPSGQVLRFANSGSGWAFQGVVTSTPTSVSVRAETNEATEGSGSAEFRVLRSGDTSAALTVHYSVSGSASAGDYSQTLSGTVVIPAGQSEAKITVTPTTDGQIENDETITITITPDAAYAVAYPSADTAVLHDADISTIRLDATDPLASEVGPDAGQFTITRTLSDGELTVYYDISGSARWKDYTLELTGSATFADGQDTIVLDIVPVDDAHYEYFETLTLTLADNFLYYVHDRYTTDTITITDSDQDSAIAIDLTGKTYGSYGARLADETVAGVIPQPYWTGVADDYLIPDGPAGTVYNVRAADGNATTADVTWYSTTISYHCCPRQSRHSRPPGVSGLILAGFRDFGRPWAFL